MTSNRILSRLPRQDFALLEPHLEAVDLPVRDLGENRFQVTIFDGSGLPVPAAASTVVVTRTHASAAAIPATQTISVKVRAGATRLNNALQPIINKGTPLPANGSQPLKAAYGVGPKLQGHIDLELFQDETHVTLILILRSAHFELATTTCPRG